ncbi:hypothetical protein DNL40_10875 [Xylanimonas oleitrophica]|uniref:DUF4126 domain-containing protein n=1 Tax=Xylanimonas oleitrophica TaxID=2607479 RepID=A0A2W5WPJ6_9MICO|nr:hypothetical protein [Xylanimonas oleitrophica]PZR52613.1 hypothetical protein DNL40_10875 [Xylanimonas oleitrophica]
MPDAVPPVILRSLLLGLAGGSRSTLALLGPTAAGVVRPPGSPRVAAAARTAAAAGIAGELVGDKLPVTPSRVARGGTLVRAVAGGVGAAQLERSVPAVLAGVLGATAMTWAGYGWRRLSASRGLPDWPAAIVEDAVALTLAGVATGVVPSRLAAA